MTTRRSLSTALVILGAPSLAAAQHAARTIDVRPSIVPSVGAGTITNDRDADTGGSSPAVSAGLGVRVRPWGALLVEGMAELQSPVLFETDLRAVLPPDADGEPRRTYAAHVQRAGHFALLAVRAGVEGSYSALSGRVTAGGGWLSELREPFAGIAVGTSIGGRRARLSLDADYRRYRLDGIDVVEYPPAADGTPSFGPARAIRLPARSALVKLGLELPIGGAR